MSGSKEEELRIWHYVMQSPVDSRIDMVDQMSHEELDLIEAQEGVNLRLGKIIRQMQRKLARNPEWRERLQRYQDFLTENFPEYTKKEQQWLANHRMELELASMLWFMLSHQKNYHEAMRWLDGLTADDYRDLTSRKS
ncbi:MAG: hypothetical protein B1H40_01800 [Candidatus Latescibacteria bacterium 4484_181]|nr:MAG: hypothetical protein B1H40_01800 [Candidatus Latescibacteria bacterium 4484_181]HDN67760.1 hypothetical protein [Bacillota bacterium]